MKGIKPNSCWTRTRFHDFSRALRMQLTPRPISPIPRRRLTVQPSKSKSLRQTQGQISQLISQLESLPVVTDVAARVVINERTGTVVVGGAVQLLPAVVAHGGLEIQIQRTNSVSQPAPFSPERRNLFKIQRFLLSRKQNPPVLLPATSTVQDMANALTSLKVSPRDLIAIFQALKEAGSLQGELIIQ